MNYANVKNNTMEKDIEYIKQFKRVKRWYSRFKDINDGMVHHKNTDYYEDEVHTFFINCYHLKDWIKKSDKKKYFDVETLFNKKSGKLCMQICADFCNGSKHMEAERRPRIDKNTKITNKDIKICLGKIPPTIVLNYRIGVAGKFYNAFDIATDCVNEWKKYLRSKELN